MYTHTHVSTFQFDPEYMFQPLSPEAITVELYCSQDRNQTDSHAHNVSDKTSIPQTSQAVSLSS